MLYELAMETWVLDPLNQMYFEAKRNDTDLKSKNVPSNTELVSGLKQYCTLSCYNFYQSTELSILDQ